MIRKYLEDMQIAVTEAATGKAALSRLAESVPDLICLDLMLPESSGYAICEHVRKTASLREVPVLVISARQMPADRAAAEEVGANAYLIKPIRRAQFEATIRELLAL